ncbi:sensor histidine kinase [Amycolatopsis thailandensis]|uniref:sensor histidine kinase n=1 Tax=Amycolatopsis thailandensis TaxID=589330 RepID=UPI0036425B9F
MTISDNQEPTKKSRKVVRAAGRSSTKRADVEAAISAVTNIEQEVIGEFEEHREAQLRAMLSDGSAAKQILGEIKGDISDSLNRSHDFLQLVKQIRGNVTAILEERFPGQLPEVSAEDLPHEGAIFFSTEIMQSKIDATLYLREPNAIFATERVFEIHKYVTKYYRIYKSQTEQKEVNLRLNGSCYAKVKYNDKAVGVIIHALLDNVVKYAPAGSKADINFHEESGRVRITFQSLGPKICPEEMEKIFLPGYRSNAARERDLPGLGLGLGAARQISDMLNIDLGVEQDEKECAGFPGLHSTRFTVSFNAIDTRST